MPSLLRPQVLISARLIVGFYFTAQAMSQLNDKIIDALNKEKLVAKMSAASISGILGRGCGFRSAAGPSQILIDIYMVDVRNFGIEQCQQGHPNFCV